MTPPLFWESLVGRFELVRICEDIMPCVLSYVFPSSHPQIPCVITRSLTKYCHIIPLEVVGWLMRKFHVQDNHWLLLVTDDLDGELAAQLVMRAPQCINLTVGLSELRNNVSDMSRLEQLANNMVIPAIKEANGLPAVHWTLPVTEKGR